MEVEINWLAVLLAALANMVIGAVWYMPQLFGKEWQKIVGLKDKDMKAGAPVGYKKQKWAICNEIIKKAVENQQREFEKSLVGLGQYSLQNQYSFLSVQEDKWFKMTTNQRLYHIKKFNECKVRVTADANERVGKAIVPSTNITDGAFELDTDRCLSISHEMALSACVPETVAEGIWRKATSLV